MIDAIKVKGLIYNVINIIYLWRKIMNKEYENKPKIPTSWWLMGLIFAGSA
jgi:hypothetical protein